MQIRLPTKLEDKFFRNNSILYPADTSDLARIVSQGGHTRSFWLADYDRYTGSVYLNTGGTRCCGTSMGGVRPFMQSYDAACAPGIVEHGEFPQSVVSDWQILDALRKGLSSSTLQSTGKKYHIPSYFIGKNDEMKEFIYDGHKYVHDSESKEWFEVKPIEWILDGQTGLMLCKNILFYSIWNKVRPDDDSFNPNKIDLEVFLRDVFTKEIENARSNNIQVQQLFPNQNLQPQIINKHEVGDGITVSDMTLLPDNELSDVQGENNGWFQPNSKPQVQSSSVSSSSGSKIPMSGGQSTPNEEYTDYEEVEETVTETNENQKGTKKMNNSNKNSTVVVDEAPMSVTEQIEFYVRNGMSFMLHGPSGIGKTARVEQIDPDLTAVPLWNGVLPEDIVGKVRYPSGQEVAATEENGANGIWVEPDWYVELKRKCAEEPDKMHVLFIDEVTNARPTTQSLIFHLTLKKSITPSKGKLPENSVVILAGNNRDESEAAYNMPEPLFRRMSGHIYLEPNVREWMVWGSESSYKHPNEAGRTNIHPVVTSFVGTYGDAVFYSEYKEEESKYALDPRGWEQISDIIYDNQGVIRRELLVAKMGSELAANFLAFAKIPQLSVEDVVNGNYDRYSLPKSQDAKLALTLNLRHADEKQQKKVRRFIADNLGKEYCSVFDAAMASSELAGKHKGMAFKLGGWGRNG